MPANSQQAWSSHVAIADRGGGALLELEYAAPGEQVHVCQRHTSRANQPFLTDHVPGVSISANLGSMPEPTATTGTCELPASVICFYCCICHDVPGLRAAGHDCHVASSVCCHADAQRVVTQQLKFSYSLDQEFHTTLWMHPDIRGIMIPGDASTRQDNAAKHGTQTDCGDCGTDRSLSGRNGTAKPV